MAVACLASCFSSSSTTCGDIVCPPGKTCADGRCVLPAQISGCDGLADGAPCSFGQASGACANHVCVPAGCGNGIVEAGEVCDDGNVVSGDGCSADCKSNETCGNAYVDIREGCDCGDGSQPATSLPQACKGQPNSSSPGAFCRTDCQPARCGDGIRDPGEECEGSDLGGKTCQDLGYYRGTLACLPGGCTFDVSSCSGKCGDNILDPQEQCDGAQLAGKDCTSLGYYAAPGLSCNSACVFDPSGCGGGKCGDGIVNGPEPCDGPGPTGLTCQDLNYHVGGALPCTSLCTLDVSGCSETCGDGIKNGPEDCDGTDLGGATCQDLGWYGGTLACRSFCSYDQSGCFGKCGDGSINGTEQCDGTALNGKTCSDFGFSQSPGLACTLCSYDTTDCMGICGDGYIETPEACDAPSFNGRTCLDDGFDAGRLGCSVLCGETQQDCSSFGPQQLLAAPILSGWSNGSVAFFGDANGTVWRYDGTTWTSWAIGGSGWGSIFGTSATDVWVAEGGPVSSSSPLYHFDGTTWTNVVTGAQNGNSAMWASSPTDVFVVGNQEIEHYNGSTWSRTALTGVFLFSVWGASPTNVYAAGGSGVYHYNGTSWAAVTVPLGGYSQFLAVSGSSASDVNVVSDRGEIAHFDGTSWTTSQPAGLAGETLNTIWETGSADVYVGAKNLLHWDGASWTQQVTTPNVHAIVPFGTGLLVGTDTGVYRSATAWLATATTPPTSFNAVWETATGEVHIPAAYSDELHYAAGSWDSRVIYPSAFAASMWGTGPSDIFVGSYNQVRHFDGTSWTSSMTTGGTQSPIVGISGTASNNVFAIDTTVNVYHYNGSSWSSTSVFSLGTNGLGVWAIGSEAFAIGTIGHIAHLSGGAWKAMTSPTTNNLHGIWGATNTNVWAVGAGGTIVHYDGTSWTAATSPVTDNLFAVWGTSASNVYAVGAAGDVLHYDGTAWTRTMATSGLTLYAIYGTSASDIWATGGDAVGGAVYHYDGTAWTRVLPFTGPINAVSGAGLGAVAVGNGGTALRFDGSMWIPVSSGTKQDLRGMYGTASSDQTAVGAAGTIVHWNGTAWSTVTSGTTANLNAIWNGYIVGNGGTILQGSGTSWAAMASGTTQDLLAVWGSSATDVYAVGRGGTLLHGNGASWTALASGTLHDLYAVSGSGANNIWAVGDFGVATHWDGAAWRASWTGTPQALDAVYVGGAADVLAGGAAGQLLFYDGARWTTIRGPNATERTTSITGTAARLAITGSQGTIGGLVRPITCGGAELCGDRWDNDCNGLAETSDPACGSPPAEQCTNGVDDDRDGLVDCEDPDCTGQTYCVRGGACQARYVIHCGDMLTGTTAAAPKLDDYPCSPGGEAGGEANYKLLLAAPATVTATVTSASSLDVMWVGAAASGGCEPWTQCYAGGSGSVTFAAPAGASFLVIDSPSAFSAAYTINVTCQ